MLKKITKLIGFGVIIGLSGLCAWGNRIDVFYEGGPTLVVEGIDGVELPAELFCSNDSILWKKYYFSVAYIGLRLNLPEELVQKCGDNYWKIYDEQVKQSLEKASATEESFHAWCDQQKEIDNENHIALRNFYRICAYMLKIANEKNYLVPGDFCKRIEIHNVLDSIYLKGAVRCMPDYTTPLGKYIKRLGGNIRSCFIVEQNNEED